MLLFQHNDKNLIFRKVLWLVTLLGFVGVGSSLFAQYVLGMNPCVMCIQQRMALGGVAVLGLLALLLPRSFWGRTLAVLLVAAPAVFGLVIAVKQLYLQSLPLHLQPPCGAPWTFRWRNMPLFDYYEWFIRGSGACGEVYKVLGVPLPMWSMLFFSLVLLLLVWAYFKAWRVS